MLNSIRRHLTYANVVSTICLFLLLGGATAFAAKQLAKNSVGTKQLKNNAVTAVKIKDGAVGSSDLAAGSVTGGKLAPGSVGAANLADGSVTAGKLDLGLFVPHVVTRLVATQQVRFVNGSNVVYQFDTPAFTQPAGEDDLLIGGITVRFDSGCKTPRNFVAQLLKVDPNGTTGLREIASAIGPDENGDEELTADFGSIGNAAGPVGLLALGAPRQHRFQVRLLQVNCGIGSPQGAGAVATRAELDVIGIH